MSFNKYFDNDESNQEKKEINSKNDSDVEISEERKKKLNELSFNDFYDDVDDNTDSQSDGNETPESDDDDTSDGDGSDGDGDDDLKSKTKDVNERLQGVNQKFEDEVATDKVSGRLTDESNNFNNDLKNELKTEDTSGRLSNLASIFENRSDDATDDDYPSL